MPTYLAKNVISLEQLQGGLDNIELAKTYYSQAIKSNPNNLRALYGLFLVNTRPNIIRRFHILTLLTRLTLLLLLLHILVLQSNKQFSVVGNEAQGYPKTR